MKICSVPDYRGVLIQVGAADGAARGDAACSWGADGEDSGTRPWPRCCPSEKLGALTLLQ